MSQCIKALREFFENCKVFIYERDWNGLMMIHEPKPFALKQSWAIDKCDSERKFCGTGMMDDLGEVIWKDEFIGGPFCIPLSGGSIECRYHRVSIGPYEAGTLFGKPKKRRLRKLSEARIGRLRRIYEEYGKINGWGIEFDKNHQDAIAIYYETAHNLNNAPKYFESWPVVCHVFGPIKLDSKKKKKKEKAK